MAVRGVLQCSMTLTDLLGFAWTHDIKALQKKQNKQTTFGKAQMFILSVGNQCLLSLSHLACASDGTVLGQQML